MKSQYTYLLVDIQILKTLNIPKMVKNLIGDTYVYFYMYVSKPNKHPTEDFISLILFKIAGIVTGRIYFNL